MAASTESAFACHRASGTILRPEESECIQAEPTQVRQRGGDLQPIIRGGNPRLHRQQAGVESDHPFEIRPKRRRRRDVARAGLSSQAGQVPGVPRIGDGGIDESRVRYQLIGSAPAKVAGPDIVRASASNSGAESPAKRRTERRDVVFVTQSDLAEPA